MRENAPAPVGRHAAALRAVILDVDGTLVDSTDAHARAWVEALADQGIDVPFERVRPLIGMGGDKVLPELTGLSQGNPRGKALSDRRATIFRERYLSDLRPFPKARELLERMRGERLTLVVASSSKEDELRPLLQIAGAADLVEQWTSADDAPESKPDPDIVAAALQRTGQAAAAALMLGDTPYDIEAAARTGVGGVALRCGGWPDERLAGALAIYDDPADLLAHFGASPFARR